MEEMLPGAGLVVLLTQTRVILVEGQQKIKATWHESFQSNLLAQSKFWGGRLLTRDLCVAEFPIDEQLSDLLRSAGPELCYLALEFS